MNRVSGKYKKKKVYVVRKKGNTDILLFGAAAVAAYFLFTHAKGADTITPTPDTTTPTPLTTTNTPRIVDDGSGTGTNIIQPTPVTVSPGANLPAVSTTAATDREVLLRDASAYPDIITALSKMTSQEIIDSYQYFYNYFLPNKILYRYPDPSAPGQWNTALYDAVQVIRDKYHIF